MSDFAQLEAIGTPVFVVDDGREIVFANHDARELFGDVVGVQVDGLFRDPGTWDLCLAAGGFEAELIAQNLPIRAGVRTHRLETGERPLTVATLVVHEVREMLAGLTHILGAGGNLEMLFKRLTPFLQDRIPYRRCSLAIWREDLQQFELHSHHPDSDGKRDQSGDMIDVNRLEELLSAIKDRQQPILREFRPAQRAWLNEITGFEVGPVCHLPLHYQGRLLGALSFIRAKGERFEEHELRRLRPLVGTLSLGVEVALLVRDVRQREQQIRERAAVTTADDETESSMYHVIDHEGTITDVSDAEAAALGYERDQLIGRPLGDVLSAASRTQLRHALAEFRRTRRLAFQGEREFRRKDGSPLAAHLNSVVHYDDAGKLEHVKTYLTDVTQQKMLQERRLQAQKLESLGRMIAGITHEFNNLLGPILGYAQLLRRKPQSESMDRELGQIEDAAQKARAMLESMLRFARQTKPQKRYQDLSAVLQGAVDLAANRAVRHHIAIELQMPDDVPWTRVDETQLTQLFLNLINNAIEACSDANGRGQLRIDVNPQGSWIQVVFRDDAGGIDDAILPHLFDPFFSTRSDGKGTGLGLATCFGIVADHGGSIEASNATLEGRPGARFEILLPVRRRPTMTIKRSHALQQRPDLTGQRALVVEDDERYNQMICELLEDIGAAVTAARDGEEGSAYLSGDEPFDLVVSDIRLPGMDGTELYRWIGLHRPDLAKRVLLVTGDVLDERTRRATEQLGVEPVVKPFSLTDFYQRLGQLLGD